MGSHFPFKKSYFEVENEQKIGSSIASKNFKKWTIPNSHRQKSNL
jgi:hypothetical protein